MRVEGRTSFFADWAPSTVSAGFVGALVGVTSSIAIIYQAAMSLGATPAHVASWIGALSLGIGLGTMVPSLILRKPVMVAWSTSGAAVLATAAMSGGFTLAQATGAFLISAALITLAGATGWFERVMDRLPMPLANGLLAGVLSRFALDGFLAVRSEPALVLAMFAAYLAGKRWWPLYSVPVVLAVGIAVAAFNGSLHTDQLAFTITRPVFVAPEFSVQALISLALPLFIVTMASQNLPGVAAMRAAGYAMPISKLLTLTGVLTLLLAPFGAYTLCFAAITAAICMGRDVHADMSRRYTASVVCGVLYLVLAVFGAAVAGLLTAFPPALVSAIAGLALLGTIGGALTNAFHDDRYREAALITFLVTVSGLSIAGVGSAFWGIVAGGLALFVQQSSIDVCPPPRMTASSPRGGEQPSSERPGDGCSDPPVSP